MSEAREKWPRLSRMVHRREMTTCQSCGHACHVGSDADVWREHDDQDRPEEIFIVLCRRCADRIIEPHPRLYARQGRYDPMPGAMPVCQVCRHCVSLTCLSPLLLSKGGPGLKIGGEPPTTAFVCKRGGRGGAVTIYSSPRTCEGKEN